MTPGLRTFGVMFILFFFLNFNSPYQTSGHIKLVVRLVIAYGHFNLPQGFVCVCMVCVGMHSPNVN